MTHEQLVGRLRIVEGDLAYGRYTLALQSLSALIDDVRAAAADLRRSPLADLPRGVRITIERVEA